ncbi:MAG: YifB family Mg chelatase-like AAA ATPase [Candidatus Peribacteraceae bacterium]
MLTQLTSFTTLGLSALPVQVEIGVTPTSGEPKFLIVGLGDTAVQESKQRVIMALKSSGYRTPMGRVTSVNLAPAHIRKAGSRFDLPIALGVLLSNNAIEIPASTLASTAFLGELAFDGSLRHVIGVLSCALSCRAMGIKSLVVPAVNGAEAALVPGIQIIAVPHLKEVIACLRGEMAPPDIAPPACAPDMSPPIDFADVRGQAQAKRALEIAAAGGHNVLMSGAPGSGKTLLANALRGILPPLTRDESLEVTGIYSVANLLPPTTPLIMERPLRAVHHTASGVAIVGGGQHPMPGEISLAHRGVLFLDELAEFPPQVLEVLRQPMEDRRITINRAQGTVTFPSDFILVGAMNPPKYASASAERMKRRISAPLLDRIDLTIDVQPVDIADLQRKRDPNAETSAVIRRRVLKARERQIKRFSGTSFSTNKEMGVRDIETFCPINTESEQLLRKAAERLQLSARAYHRVIKVARTIADLAESDGIELPHIAEALQYRQGVMG